MCGLFKIVALFCTLIVIHAGVLDLQGSHDIHGGYEVGVYEAGGFEASSAGYEDDSHGKEHHPEPKYSFNYAVHDPHTGDVKHHNEERDGHVVKGSYSLKEADGTTRLVEYQADEHNGFNAKVHKIAADEGQEQEKYQY